MSPCQYSHLPSLSDPSLIIHSLIDSSLIDTSLIIPSLIIPSLIDPSLITPGIKTILSVFQSHRRQSHHPQSHRPYSHQSRYQNNTPIVPVSSSPVLSTVVSSIQVSKQYSHCSSLIIPSLIDRSLVTPGIKTISQWSSLTDTSLIFPVSKTTVSLLQVSKQKL
jgi:hypothetical protein